MGGAAFSWRVRLFVARLHWICLCTLLMGFALPGRAATLGDVTGDGRATVADVVLILKFIVRVEVPTAEQFAAADVSPHPGLGGAPVGDRRLELLDAIRVLRYTTGLINPADFGTGDRYIVLTPSRAVAAPLDRVAFSAVPINLDGPIVWTLTGDETRIGEISTDGVYFAPRLITSADLSVVVHARVGDTEATAMIVVTDTGAPPPPPI